MECPDCGSPMENLEDTYYQSVSDWINNHPGVVLISFIINTQNRPNPDTWGMVTNSMGSPEALDDLVKSLPIKEKMFEHRKLEDIENGKDSNGAIQKIQT